jgi:hypothetical protein
LYARGLATGDIAAHIARCMTPKSPGAPSPGLPTSRVADWVVEEMQAWTSLPTKAN